MLPVLTPEQMAVVDGASGPVEQLIERAGWAVAHEAARMLGGCYGRRVVVIAGKGNNGADGRVAAHHLRRRGVRVDVVDVDVVDVEVRTIATCDLLIDAAFGTGLRDTWEGPETSARVLAVDIPSGLDPVTGEDRGGLTAEATVTFGAHKPGLLLGQGPRRAGRVVVAPIGLNLDAVATDTWLWTDEACAEHLPRRPVDSHKWKNAVRVIGGSAGMEGAPGLAASAAMRAGSGMVVVSRPDGGRISNTERSAVDRVFEPGGDWVGEALDDIDRFASVVIGPGLGSDDDVGAGVREFVARCPIPIVIDADALRAVAGDPACLARREAPTVLTPHDGEFEALTGSAPGPDRIAHARSLASNSGVVLLKGPTTIVAAPDGNVALVDSGDQRLATAGSGDVLAGVIAAMDLGHETGPKVASAAHWHGLAGSIGARTGIVADDVAVQLSAAWELMGGHGRRLGLPYAVTSQRD